MAKLCSFEEVELWLSREVAFHPRGYYRLALSIAKKQPLTLWGQRPSPIHIEGPLEREIEEAVWRELVAPPKPPPTLTIHYTDERPTWKSALLPFIRDRNASFMIVCNPADLWRCLYSRCVWDIWEDYERNFRQESVYTLGQSFSRRVMWHLLQPFRVLVHGYVLAEYAYAPLVSLRRARFLPNAFISVQNAPPLLPRLAGSYALYTGNITYSWGALEAIQQALQASEQPFVIAGSPKPPQIEQALREALRRHPAWLWIKGRFVPYPIIQNLQRYSALLYAPYRPLPHLRDKVPGKFYEAAAQKVPIRYPVGKSTVWDAFWKRYRNASDAPELYWSYYEGELWDWIDTLRAK
ncbi:MAG: hypothetical protein ABDH66_04400 [Bacteroidia bacterium]